MHKAISDTPTSSCITGFYHAIPGGYIYMCLYGNALSKLDIYYEVKK